tara:strand:- start:290 stop:550 length:261 start_codon:yes stop_codon:yes gene_type:complete
MKIILKNNYSITKLQKDYVLLNNETGKYLLLNEISKEILDLIGEGITFENLLKDLRINYDVEEDRADIDLKDFLKECKKLKIIEID